MVITKTWWYNKYIYFESNNREKNPPMNKQTPPPPPPPIPNKQKTQKTLVIRNNFTLNHAWWSRVIDRQ